MKKAILYLVFIILLVSNTGHARAIAMGHKAVASGYQKKEVPAVVIHKMTLGSREYVFTYIDEYDESDCDDHETVIKDKSFVTAIPYLWNGTLTVPFLAIPYGVKAYHQVHFSRLPRYNYISLKVLRL
jgi:hypothetical protein